MLTLARRSRRQLCWSAATLLSVFAGQAFADVPAALDRAPKGAVLAVGFRDVGALRARLGGMFKKFEAPMEETPLAQVDAFLNADGFNKGGSAAFVLMGDPAQEDFNPDNAIVIAPVSDFKKFAAAMGGDATQKIVMLSKIAPTAAAKDIGGGFMVMGEEPAVKAFEAPQGQIAGHKTVLGKAGGRIADTSDVVVISNLGMLNKQMSEGIAGFKDQMGMFAAMAGGNADMAKGMEQMQKGMEAFARDVQTGLMGLTMNDAGVSMDFAAQFKDGSEMAGAFQHAGKLEGVVGKLPKIPFLFAGAIDMSNPTLRKLVQQMSEVSAAGAGSTAAKMLDKVQAQGFIMGTNAALLQAGLFANTLSYSQTADPAGVIAIQKEGIEKTNGTEQKGVKYASSFTTGGAEVAGRKVDTWKMKMEIDPNSDAAAQMQQMMMIFTGQSGEMTGMVAATKSGVVTTMSSNSELMGKALDAADGKGGLADDAQLKLSASALPPARTFELFLGVKGIIDTVGGFMQNFGMPLPFEVGTDMPPIAVGGTTDGGGAAIRLHVPMAVIDEAAKIVKKMKQAEEGDNNEEEKPKPKDERRKPRF